MTDSPHLTAMQANAAHHLSANSPGGDLRCCRHAWPYTSASRLKSPTSVTLKRALSADPSAYAARVRDLELNNERLVLITALAPHLRPALSLLRIKNNNLDNPFAEFGGIHSSAVSAHA